MITIRFVITNKVQISLKFVLKMSETRYKDTIKKKIPLRWRVKELSPIRRVREIFFPKSILHFSPQNIVSFSQYLSNEVQFLEGTWGSTFI